MGAITDLLKSERGIVAIALLAAATVGLLTDRLTTDQWVTYTQWLFVTYAASKTVTGGLAILKGTSEPSAAPSSTVVPLVALLVIGAAVTSAGCTASQRTDTIRASLTAVNTARDGFTTWDGQHQHELVAHAGTRADAESAIINYHHARQPVVDGFEVAYRLLAVAATSTDDPSLKAALAKAAEVIDLAKRLTLPEAPPLRRGVSTTTFRIRNGTHGPQSTTAYASPCLRDDLRRTYSAMIGEA